MTVPPRDMFPVPGDNIELTKPTIAAVNGVAFAGGWMIAQACDLCVASTSAKFAITEVKVGRSSPWAAPLIHMIPQRIMMEIVLTGKPITAQRAYEIGLVNRLAEPDAADGRRARAGRRDSRRRAAVGAGGARHGDALDRDGPFGGSARCAGMRRNTPIEARTRRKAREAFAEKRRPQWKGR